MYSVADHAAELQAMQHFTCELYLHKPDVADHVAELQAMQQELDCSSLVGIQLVADHVAELQAMQLGVSFLGALYPYCRGPCCGATSDATDAPVGQVADHVAELQAMQPSM